MCVCVCVCVCDCVCVCVCPCGNFIHVSIIYIYMRVSHTFNVSNVSCECGTALQDCATRVHDRGMRGQ